MPYSGAVKTNLYGAWLRLTGARFTLASWRLSGLLLIAAGIVLFCVLAGPALPPWAMAVFLALLLTDGTVLLAGRFDWGPVALSLSIRLALLGLWIGSEAGEGPSVRSSVGLGGLVGFAAFEKLSALVLVPPLAAMVLGSPRRRERRHLLAVVAGFAAGALPLAAVHLGALAVHGQPISLGGGPGVERSPAGFLAFVGDYLALGQGAGVRSFVLGLGRLPRLEILEAAIAAAVASSSCPWLSGGKAGHPGPPFAARGSPWRATGPSASASISCRAPPGSITGSWAPLSNTRPWPSRCRLSRAGPGDGRPSGSPSRLSPFSGWPRGCRGSSRPSGRWPPAGRRPPGTRRWRRSAGSRRSGRRERSSSPRTGVWPPRSWPSPPPGRVWSTSRSGVTRGRSSSGPSRRRAEPASSTSSASAILRRTVPGALERIEHDLLHDPRWREVPVEAEAARLRQVLVRKLVRRPEAQAGPASSLAMPRSTASIR